MDTIFTSLSDRKRLQLSLETICLLIISISMKGGEGATFPYGRDVSDNEMTTGSTQKLDMAATTDIRFFGSAYKSVWLSNDGLIAFQEGVQYHAVDWREGTPVTGIDKPFIAPFHYEAFVPVSTSKYKGKIYYRKLLRSSGDAGDIDFMDFIDRYLENATVVLKSGFHSDAILRVTWENVTSRSSCDDDKVNNDHFCPTNTFQLVLVWNQAHTFAIFNYDKMEIPFSNNQLAGVNGGQGRGWADVVPCVGQCEKLSKRVGFRNLTSGRGSDVTGRYILAVNGDSIVRGGCLMEGLKQVQMEVFPREVGMFGGEMLAVSWDCSQPGVNIYCGFGDDGDGNPTDVTEGVMETAMRGRCPVPILTTRGRVPIQISLNKQTWKHRSTLHVVLPSRMPWPMDISADQANWYKVNTTGVSIPWHKEHFSSDSSATLYINLLGYREDETAQEKLVIKQLAQLATGVPIRNERYTVDPARFSCSSNCEDFEIGWVQIGVEDRFVDNSTKYKNINLGPVTLGWYVNKALTSKYGQDWPAAKCKAWYATDRQSSTWHDRLLACPCTLTQALADWGRWQPDVSCNMFTGSVCTYHKKAKHCVRTVQASPDGSGNQCCYEPDGNLRYSDDTYQGSTPDRSHDWGAAPFGQPSRVPSLSHWLHDVVTFYYCCLWVDYRDCQYYMDRRATKDCKAYTTPHAATAYGDPHITTFDGKDYYFQGKGDFWLLQSQDINIQARFQERTVDNLHLNASQFHPTVLTSLVLWRDSPQTDRVTVRLAPTNKAPGIVRKLDILVNGHRHFFDNASDLWQDFDNVSVVNNMKSAQSDEDLHHSNFTIIVTGGSAVQVSERHGQLRVVVLLPPGARQTGGLLGRLDGNASNDFTSPQGTTVHTNAVDYQVYRDFALKWAVSENDSKFHFHEEAEQSKDPVFGEHQNFKYRNASRIPSQSDIDKVCAQSSACARDYYVTGNALIGKASAEAQTNLLELRKSHTPVATCGLLDIPMASKSSTVYLAGSVVTVTGCRPNGSKVQTSGPMTYTCMNSSTGLHWSPQPQTDLCPHIGLHEGTTDAQTNVGMIVGIVVGVVAVIAIVIAVVIIILQKRRQSGRDLADKPVPARRTQVPTDVVIDPGTSETMLKHKDDRRPERKPDVQSSV